MPAHTSLSPSSSLSPKPLPPDPNRNPFSPLSPDLPENRLRPIGAAGNADPTGDGDDEVNELLGLAPSRRALVCYPRHQLLAIGRKCRSSAPPAGMGGLETWFGSVPRPNPQHVDDPAIASIGPPSGSSRRGGFGEGFGFGGGIGGRGLGRGNRNIGLRRQPEPALDPNGLPVDNRIYGGQMGRFSVRAPNNGSVRVGGDEPKRERRKDEEWRRPERNMPREPRRNYQLEDDSIEPAWMDDVAPADPAIAESSDPLIKFVPGEDMIAAHKRAMKARDVANDWRGDGNLPSFFASDPAIASSSAPPLPPGLGPKSFNAADYLTQAQEAYEEEPAAQPAPPTSAFTSRFQKFFHSPAAEPEPSPEPKPQEDPKDDRMARLMGLLSTKPTSPMNPSPSNSSPHDPYRHLSSPPAELPNPHFSPNFYGNGPANGQRPPSHPNALLQQLYGNPNPNANPQERSVAPDPLQLLSQAQRQPQQQPQPQPQPQPQAQPQQRPPHMSMPPQFARPHMYQDDAGPPPGPPGPPGYPSFSQAPYPNMPPGYPPPMPHFFQGPPPPRPGLGPGPAPGLVHGYPGPGPAPAPNYGAPPAPPHHHQQQQQQQQQQRQYPLGAAQQDMLATLFAGLGPRS